MKGIKILLILALIVSMPSCKMFKRFGMTKTEKLNSKAADELEELKLKYPFIVDSLQRKLPVTIAYRGEIGIDTTSWERVEYDVDSLLNLLDLKPQVLREVITEVVNNPCLDDTLNFDHEIANVKIFKNDSGNPEMYLRTKDRELTGQATVTTDIIIPTSYDPNFLWWHIALMVSGVLFWMILLIVLVYFISRAGTIKLK